MSQSLYISFAPLTEAEINRKLRLERLAKVVFRSSLIITIIFLVLITFYVLVNGLKLFGSISPVDFLFGRDWDPVNQSLYGILPMIITSVYITIASIIVATPLGLGCAIFTSEIRIKFIKNVVQSAVSILAGIPSVVYGLIGYSLLVPYIQALGPESSGYSMLAAICILSVMILPTILSISQDALKNVPKELYRGSLALGATRFQTITKICLPIARPGIVAAIVLAVSRAFGEAMAVKMVLGNIQTMPNMGPNHWFGLLSEARALTSNIILEIEYAYSGTYLESLFATGAVLFLITMLVNYCAYVFVRKTKKIKKKHRRKKY